MWNVVSILLQAHVSDDDWPPLLEAGCMATFTRSETV